MLEESRRLGVTTHASGGAAGFKRQRGATSTVEYVLVYTRHLPWHQACAWHALRLMLIPLSRLAVQDAVPCFAPEVAADRCIAAGEPTAGYKVEEADWAWSLGEELDGTCLVAPLLAQLARRAASAADGAVDSSSSASDSCGLSWSYRIVKRGGLSAADAAALRRIPPRELERVVLVDHDFPRLGLLRRERWMASLALKLHAAHWTLYGEVFVVRRADILPSSLPQQRPLSTPRLRPAMRRKPPFRCHWPQAPPMARRTRLCWTRTWASARRQRG